MDKVVVCADCNARGPSTDSGEKAERLWDRRTDSKLEKSEETLIGKEVKMSRNQTGIIVEENDKTVVIETKTKKGNRVLQVVLKKDLIL